MRNKRRMGVGGRERSRRRRSRVVQGREKETRACRRSRRRKNRCMERRRNRKCGKDKGERRGACRRSRSKENRCRKGGVLGRKIPDGNANIITFDHLPNSKGLSRPDLA